MKAKKTVGSSASCARAPALSTEPMAAVKHLAQVSAACKALPALNTWVPEPLGRLSSCIQNSAKPVGGVRISHN